MHHLDIAKMTYSSGKIVEVSDELIRNIFHEVGKDLGVPSQDYSLRLLFIPEKMQRRMPFNAAINLGEGILVTPKAQHEAVLYHEGVHYNMGKKGLLFAPDPRNGTIYDRLIDESVAELATYQKFGYNDKFTSDSVELFSNLKKKIESLQKSNYDGENAEMKNLEQIFTSVRIPGEIISKHREIEDKYRGTQDLDSISPDLEEFLKYISGMNKPEMYSHCTEAIRALATDNAKRILKKGITSKKMVATLDDSVKNGWPAYAIYFVDIIGE